MVPASGITGYCWLGAPCYSLIALWFTRVLGLFAVVSQWMWLITPVKRVGWSVIRLVRALASETKVNERILMGAVVMGVLIGRFSTDMKGN